MTKQVKHQGIRCAINGDGELMIYGFVGDWWDELEAKQVIDQLKALGDPDPLVVRINSPGGFVFEGMAIYNYLKQYKGKVVVKIDGLAASMASGIAMAADEIIMPENALMMIHNPWDVSIGDAEQLRKDADMLDTVKRALMSAYREKTTLDESEISTMMDAETWMTGAEAVEMGFADTLEESVDISAVAVNDVSKFKHVPDYINELSAHRAENCLKAVAALVPGMTGNVNRATGAQPYEETVMTKKANQPDGQGAGASPVTPNGQEPAAPVPGTEPVDVNKAVNEAVAAERDRSNSIRAFGTKLGLNTEVVETEIAKGATVDISKAALADVWADQPGDNGGHPNAVRIENGPDAVDKFRDGAMNAVLMRAGMSADEEVGNEFRGFTLRELARASLELHNVNTRGMSALNMVANAFTHSGGDFDHILADVAHKSMMRGYEEAGETFQQWTATGSLTDFKPSKRVDLNAFPSLREVRPGAEYKYATIGDRGESIQLATYGELFSINRQTIINDDLDAFTKVPMRMGKAAIRTVGDLVYAILTGNPDMSDGNALFDGSHNNLLTGAAITTASIDAMMASMAKQKDRDSKATALNISLAYLLVPVALRGTALTVRDSEKEVTSNKNNTTPNWVRGTFDVIADARLDAVSTSNWFGAASPASTDTIEVAYLDGQQSPMLEQKQGWSVDGTEFKVRIDAGVKALAWEGLAKNPN